MATIREIKERYAEEAALVEVWQFKDEQRKKHSDYISFCDDISDDTVVYDYDFYDVEDYNHTIYANCGESEDYEGDALIIWVEHNAKERKSIERIAEENNLEIITTRSGDYLTGFDTWKDVEEFCERFDDEQEDIQKAQPVILHHKDGRGWEYQEWTYEPLNSTDEEISRRHDGFLIFDKDMSEEEFIKEEILAFEPQSFNELNDLIERKQEIWRAMDNMGDNDVVVVDDGGNWTYAERNCLRDRHDTHNWLIAVEIENED